MARDAVIHGVKPYLLHGELYEMLNSYTNEPDTLRQSRIAPTNIYPQPRKRVTTPSYRPS